MTHAAEKGRFYDREGNPCYEVPYADKSKGTRPATLADAKKLGLYPSVTTVIAEANKPALNDWKVQQAILAAMTLPRKEGEPDNDFIERVVRDSKEQAIKAAAMGTAIHAAIQGHYEGEPPEPKYWPYVAPTIALIRHKFGEHQDWIPEQSFANPLGFAGKRDLRRPGVTLDFKSKEFGPEPKKLAWDDHVIQLAAYREPGDHCANVFVSVNNPGLVHIHEWSEEELQRGWEMFKALLDYYYARTGMKR